MLQLLCAVLEVAMLINTPWLSQVQQKQLQHTSPIAVLAVIFTTWIVGYSALSNTPYDVTAQGLCVHVPAVQAVFGSLLVSLESLPGAAFVGLLHPCTD
jgi:hypothetical protein